MNNNNVLEHLERELKESLAGLRGTTVAVDQRVKSIKMPYDRVLIVIKEAKKENKSVQKPLESLSIDCDSQAEHDSSADSGFSSPDSHVGIGSDDVFSKLPALSPTQKKSPFEKYSSESAFRQRAVSECITSASSRRGILKMPSVDDVSHRVKRVSICEEHNKLVTFNPSLSLDQQASQRETQRRKNEKKRLQKQRKATGKQDLDREDSVDPICSDYEDGKADHGGKRSNRQDSGFISDDEGEKICA